MRDGIFICGNLIVDYVKNIDGYPEAGRLCNISDVAAAPGGCAANTSIDIARIDPTVPVFAAGLIGNDDAGNFLMETFEKNHVNTDHVKRINSAPTSFTDVFSDGKAKTRTFFHARGANAEFNITDIDFDSITAEYFHIGYALLLDKFDSEDPEYGTVMARALQMAQSKGMKTCMDVVSENSDRFKKVVIPSLKYCNYAIINEVESGEVTGIDPRNGMMLSKTQLRLISEKLFEMGVKDLVCIHAKEGASIMNSKGSFFYCDSFDVPKEYIKGTVGAGDAFCAGMLYSIIKGFDLAHSLNVATGAATLSLRELNSIDGMGNISEISALIDQYAGK